MPVAVDFDALWRQALPVLLQGPARASDLVRALHVSQPTVSRLLQSHIQELLVLGRARSTRYHALRSIPSVGSSLPIYEVDEQGNSRTLARLHAVGTRGFHVESLHPDIATTCHPDLPFLLDGMRPSGFLGRLVPRQHPELELPQDIRHWSGDHALRYLSRFGWNTVGNLIVGDTAFQLFLEHASRPPAAVTARDRGKRYRELARHVLEGAPPGSSAAGEQPKFLARTDKRGEVLVKFSPPRIDSAGARVADLLVAEHVAHDVLRGIGIDACSSSLVEAGEQLFLEIVRFDRTPRGRRGVIALEALDAEFAGSAERGNWVRSVTELARLGHIDPSCVHTILWLQAFGSLIANTDMHPGNVSFFTRGGRVSGLTPVYDMLPSAYAVQQGHVSGPAPKTPTPRPSDAPVWDSASAAAEAFWDQVARHSLVSRPFQSVARAHRASCKEARLLGARLPR